MVNSDVSIANVTSQSDSTGSGTIWLEHDLLSVDISKVDPHHIDRSKLESMMKSIGESGIQEPLSVVVEKRATKKGPWDTYHLLDGRVRWWPAFALKINTIPAKLVNISTSEAAEIVNRRWRSQILDYYFGFNEAHHSSQPDYALAGIYYVPGQVP